VINEREQGTAIRIQLATNATTNECSHLLCSCSPQNHHKNSNRARHQRGQQSRDKQEEQPTKEQAAEEEEEASHSPEEDKPFRVAQSEIYGRYLVASRQLEPGETLIREEPLAIGPCVSGDPVCLGCYQPVTLKPDQYRCPDCGWPLCGSNCSGLKHKHGHTETECQLYGKRRAVAAELLTDRAGPAEVRDLYELVMIVRILLLRQHDPEQFALIARMESHTEERRQNAVLWRHYEHTWRGYRCTASWSPLPE